MSGERPHILVVDDEQRLRELLRKFLSENGFLVAAAASAEEARQQIAQFSFDLVVLDVMMPGESGLELTRSIRKDSELPILLLTALGEQDDRISGLECGADDYMAKPFEPRELLLRINNILRRAPKPVQSEAPREVSLGECVFDREREELLRNGELVHLTSAEITLLKALSQSPGQTISREELGRRTGIAGNLRTVDVQVARLRSKIEGDTRLPRYIHTIRGKGYLLRTD
jgi:two-component system phosphate regulon response regulator OmpR